MASVLLKNIKCHILPKLSKECKVCDIPRLLYCSNTGVNYDDDAQKKLLMSFADGGSIDVEKDERSGIATVTLNDPDVRNALSGCMMAELRNVVDDLAKWHLGKGLLLRGAGGTFCSGGNLKFMKRILNPMGGYGMSRFMSCTLNRLHNLPLISVALIEGSALGGGIELATACDFRVANSTAKMGFVHVRLGIVPGFGGGARLVQLVGRKKALDLLSLGHTLSAEEALECGLIDHIIPDTEDPYEATREWLQERTKQTAPVTRVIKEMVVNGCTRINQYTMAKEQDLFSSVWSGPAHRKALGIK